jgi:peroxiredoxin
MKRIGLIREFVLALGFAALAALPGTSAALEVGDKAPDFELPSTKGGNFKLSDLAGKKNVVVQFYVIDFTPT